MGIKGTPYIKHGMTTSSEYRSWRGMMKRCVWPGLATRPDHPDYQNYRAKGISVCERWRNFSNFLADMGTKPSPQHTIERNNGTGNYEPGNCRWATKAEQNRNHPRNRRIEFQGESLLLSEWAKRLGIGRKALASRLKLGIDLEQSLTIPPGQWKATLQRK